MVKSIVIIIKNKVVRIEIYIGRRNIVDRYLSNKIKNISFLLTILVVILHAYNIDNTISIVSFIQTFISHGIATIAVPIFFMISGYLFFYKFNLL